MSEPRELFLQKLPQIERIIAGICKRSGLDADAAEEFAADVKLRLVDEDYAVIRAFRNRSSFESYVATVVKRLLLDQRNRDWGKWRPSAEAKRLGPLALELERLIYRDWRSVEDAVALLIAKHEKATRAEIDRLVGQIPARIPRRQVDIEHATSIPVDPDDMNAVRAETARRLSCLVTIFIEQLPEADQLIMRLHFQVGMTIAQIARAMHVEKSTLYPRLYRHFAGLRAELSRAGLSKSDVEDLIGQDVPDLDFHLKNDDPRPSTEDEREERTAAVEHEERR
jgi:RNA polymerase sigma factor for flagellar operon FliA